MVKLEDHRKDGVVDWQAYRNAQRSNGEVCTRCNKYIAFGAQGYARQCQDCQSLVGVGGEVTHESLIRCPKCGECWDPTECETYPTDGEIAVSCGECGHDFEVQCCIDWTWTSPERLTEDTEPEEV